MQKNRFDSSKLVKLFETVSKTDMGKFQKYLDSKQTLNENPQLEPITQPSRPEREPQVLPSPATPATKPATKPNPFAPSIQPDADPKGAIGEAGQSAESSIDVLAKKLSDEIAATYNKVKSTPTQQSPQQGQKSEV
jgi:hypothetical protein